MLWCWLGLDGFFGQCLLGITLLIAHAMIFNILYLELPACRRGEVSSEHPR